MAAAVHQNPFIIHRQAFITPVRTYAEQNFQFFKSYKKESAKVTNYFFKWIKIFSEVSRKSSEYISIYSEKYTYLKPISDVLGKSNYFKAFASLSKNVRYLNLLKWLSKGKTIFVIPEISERTYTFIETVSERYHNNTTTIKVIAASADLINKLSELGSFLYFAGVIVLTNPQLHSFVGLTGLSLVIGLGIKTYETIGTFRRCQAQENPLVADIQKFGGVNTLSIKKRYYAWKIVQYASLVILGTALMIAAYLGIAANIGFIGFTIFISSQASTFGKWMTKSVSFPIQPPADVIPDDDGFPPDAADHPPPSERSSTPGERVFRTILSAVGRSTPMTPGERGTPVSNS